MSVAMFSNNIQVGPKNMVVTKTPLTAAAKSYDITKVATMKITEVGLFWFRFNIVLVMEETLTQTQIQTESPEFQQFLMCCVIESPSGIQYPLKSCAPCYFQTLAEKNSVSKPGSSRTLNIVNDMLPCNEAGTWTVNVVANCGYSGSDASIGYNISESDYVCRKISNYQF